MARKLIYIAFILLMPVSFFAGYATSAPLGYTELGYNILRAYDNGTVIIPGNLIIQGDLEVYGSHP